jgi:tellurite resistance protein TehA-like permease
MSTGIVSLACHFMGLAILALVLFWMNVGFYLILWCLSLLRLTFSPRSVLKDLQSHSRGVGFFTVTAGTCILGSQCLILLNTRGWGVALWCLGVCLGVLLLYSVFSVLITGPVKPTLPEGINGEWMLTTVSLQSMAILTALVVSQFPAWQAELVFLSLGLFLVGVILYIVIITLIFYRLLFFPLEPAAFESSYWITAGADAITSLAGITLMANSHGSRLLELLRPFLLGLTILAWASATCWLPLLIILMTWRHAVRRLPMVYAPASWGMVFPLGMYTVCTWQLAGTIQIAALQHLARGWLIIALSAWLFTFLGLLRSSLRTLSSPS